MWGHVEGAHVEGAARSPGVAQRVREDDLGHVLGVERRLHVQARDAERRAELFSMLFSQSKKQITRRLKKDF